MSTTWLVTFLQSQPSSSFIYLVCLLHTIWHYLESPLLSSHYFPESSLPASVLPPVCCLNSLDIGFLTDR